MIGLISSSNITQHCWREHIGSVGAPCLMMLDVIRLVCSALLTSPNIVKQKMLDLFEYSGGWCWMEFDWFDLLFQHRPTLLKEACWICLNTLLDDVDGIWLVCVCEVGTVGKISDCQPEGPGFNPWPGHGLNFGRPSFATGTLSRWSSISMFYRGT